MRRMFVGLIIVLLIQMFISFLFQYVFAINNVIIIEMAINLALSFVFSIFNYVGDRKGMIKDPSFHRSVAIYFVMLTIVTFIFLLF